MTHCVRVIAGATLACAVACVFGVSSAFAAVTPGWECIPTTAGQAVVSGGVASTPSCSAGTTAVLAPTFISSGVGGKPTVQFSAVNVQVVNGTSSTSTVNGEGNLVLGYDEAPGAQTGSHNLVLGELQDYRGNSNIVAGYHNKITDDYSAAFGRLNTISGTASTVAGQDNTASATGASVLGGYKNKVSAPFGAITGGCSNVVGSGTVPVNSACTDTVGHASNFASIGGGAGNQATGIDSAAMGGLQGLARGAESAVVGGEYNITGDPLSVISAGCDNITGAGTANASACTPGGEGVSGGANVSATTQDGSYP
jgi:hypothetical protein